MKWIVLIVLISFTFADGVFVLTDDNFEQTINEKKVVMVKFYAPWCGHCKKMAPEYIKLAQQVKESNEDIVIAELDATVHTKAGAKYEVKGYPKLKLFVDGVPIDYEGERTSDSILRFIRKKSQPASVELKSQEEIKRKTEIKGRRCILISDNPEHLKGYMSTARIMEKFSFFHTSEELGKTVFPEITKPSVVVLRDFGQQQLIYEGPIDSDKLANFLKKNQDDDVVDLDSDLTNEIFEKRTKKAVMLIYGDKIDEKLEKIFKAFAISKKSDEFLFVKVTNTDEQGQRIIKYFGIEPKEFPLIEILDYKSGSPIRYRFEGQFRLQQLEKFMDKYHKKELKRFMKSEPLPEKNPGPVFKVVGINFKKEVIDNDNDVLVKFYAEWCGHCKRLIPIYEEVAEQLKKNTKLKLMEIDGTKNDVEGVITKSYPTIFFFPAGKKDEPIKYDKQRTKEDFIQFLKEKATNPIELHKQDL